MITINLYCVHVMDTYHSVYLFTISLNEHVLVTKLSIGGLAHGKWICDIIFLFSLVAFHLRWLSKQSTLLKMPQVFLRETN